MTVPVVTVRIAFTTAPFATTPTWVDVSADYIAHSFRRGRQAQLARIEAGEGSVLLKNFLGNYWPLKAAGAYYPNVTTDKKINIRATDLTYPKWISPASYTDADAAWTDEAKAYDGSLVTYSYCSTDSHYLTLAPAAAILCSKIRIYTDTWSTIGGHYTGSADITIDVYYGAAWHTLSSTAIAGSAWVEANLASEQLVSNARIKINGAILGHVDIFEFQFGQSTLDRFTGYVREWNPTWFSPEGLLYSCMQLSIVDAQAILAGIKVNTTGWPSELTGARVARVLDAVGFPAADRVIDTGTQTVQAGDGSSVFAMDHLYIVQDTEMGQLFFRGDGFAIFHDRMKRVGTSSLASYGEGGIPIYEPKLPFNNDLVYNDVRLTRVGGTEQVATDATSITNHTQRTYSKSGLLLATDALTLELAQDIRYMYKNPSMYVKNIGVKLQAPGHEAATWPEALSRDISDKITIVRAEAGINNAHFIEGNEESYDCRDGEWITKFQTSDAAVQFPVRETITLHPNAAGDLAQLYRNPNAGEANWQDVLTIGSGNYVYAIRNPPYTYPNIQSDLYNLDPPPALSGILTATIHANVWKDAGNCTMRFLIKTATSTYYSGYVSLPIPIAEVTFDITSLITVADLANLQIGYECDGDTYGNRTGCDCIYVSILGYKA